MKSKKIVIATLSTLVTTGVLAEEKKLDKAGQSKPQGDESESNESSESQENNPFMSLQLAIRQLLRGGDHTPPCGLVPPISD